jgi:hypothetical protein
MACITAFILLLAIPMFSGVGRLGGGVGVESCAACGVGRELDIEKWKREEFDCEICMFE